MMLTEKQKSVIDFFLQKEVGYWGYPADIERGTRHRVSRMSAGPICDRLVRMGIADKTNRRSPNRRTSTAHYRLKDDWRAFALLVREYVKVLSSSYPMSWQRSALYFMQTQYVRHHLTEALVRRILSSRGVGMQVIVPLDESHSLSKSVGLLLPVAPPNAKTNPKQVFLTKPESLSSKETRIVNEVIEAHYRINEKYKLILPILALLEVSPTALMYFLGKWNPYRSDTFVLTPDSPGIEMVEHVVFRLIWAAINDLAVSRNVPEGRDVTIASVCPGVWRTGKETTNLLSLNWQYRAVIDYNAGFDTTHEYSGNGEAMYEIELNPSNAWVTITWKEQGRSESRQQGPNLPRRTR